jgi:predicted nucleotidyltransferase
MIEPRRIGRFLATDRAGYVQPDVAVDLIGSVWRPLVDFVVGALMNRDGVRAVYLRGSIPRGLAIENFSDADFIYLSDTDFDRADSVVEETAKAKFPIVSDLKLFRLTRSNFAKIHHPQQRPYFHMLIKTQSLFLAGDDLAKHIEPFRIGSEMVSHVFALENEFAKSQRWLANLPASIPNEHKNTAERSVRRWIFKRIVRSGFEVTMNRTEHFTRDLYLCYEQFAKFYPEHAKQMYQVLVNCLNGDHGAAKCGELVHFLTGEGLRLLADKNENGSTLAGISRIALSSS